MIWIFSGLCKNEPRGSDIFGFFYSIVWNANQEISCIYTLVYIFDIMCPEFCQRSFIIWSTCDFHPPPRLAWQCWVVRVSTQFGFSSSEHGSHPESRETFEQKGSIWSWIVVSICIYKRGSSKRALIFVFVFKLLTVLRLNDVSQMAFLLLQPNKQNLTFYSWKAIGERKCWLILQYLIDIIKRKC